MSSASPGLYDVLESAKSHIRLLRICGRGVDHSLILTMRTVKTVEVEDGFLAISYTWGAATESEHVVLNSTVFSLRANIWRFLNHWYDTGLCARTGRELWIDSICINQLNIPEKNAQVQRMGHIFGIAKEVIVWLGLPSETSQLASLLPAYSIDNARDFYLDNLWSRQLSVASNQSRKHREEVLTDVLMLFGSSYWSRIWVVQEISLARSALVVLGNDLMDVMVLNEIVEVIPMASTTFDRQLIASVPTHGSLAWKWRHAQVADVLFYYGSRYNEKLAACQLPLSTLIAHYKRQLCHDKRDKVYALIGMAGIQDEFEVNYEDDLEVVWWKALQFSYEGARRGEDGADFTVRDASAILETLSISVEQLFQHPEVRKELFRPEVRRCFQHLGMKQIAHISPVRLEERTGGSLAHVADVQFESEELSGAGRKSSRKVKKE